jgi:hypothetical protein
LASICRNLVLSTATSACSPQSGGNLPQPGLIYRNVSLFTALGVNLPQPGFIHRNVGLFTAIWRQFAATWACSPQRRLICRNVGLLGHRNRRLASSKSGHPWK